MARETPGRKEVRDAAWRSESYPHPLVSCMMPVVVLLALGILASLTLTLWQKSLPANVNIPKIEGLQLVDAKRRLARAGLDVEVVKEQQPSETIPLGAVITSVPPEGRIVKAGRTIRLLISAGSQYTRVPDVVNQPQGEARRLLAKARLFITSEVSKYDDTVPIDCIIAIMPKPGTKVAKNSQVKLVMSKGAKTEVIAGVDEENELRSSMLVINVPQDAAEPDDVRIEVTDRDGAHVTYSQMHSPGDTFVENIEGYGDTTARVYFGNRLILTKKI